MNQVNNKSYFHIITWKEVLFSIFIASVVAGFACYIAITISDVYYATAPYHFDSVSYRLISIRFYRILQEEGLLKAIAIAIPTRDDLDVTLRLLVAPRTLIKLYGHLVVLVPFMIGTFTLMIIYVYSRSASWLLSVIPLLFFFTFQQVYNPLQGIADYWKDSIAVWIIGCLVMTLIGSDFFQKRWWSFACGTFFGLLVLQRAGVAMLITVLFVPLLAVILLPRIKKGGLCTIRNGVAFFLLPAIILSGVFFMYDLEEFYIYNFKVGYDYWTFSQTYNHFWVVLKANKTFLANTLLVGILTIYIVCKSKWQNNINAIFIMSLILLFPVEIICMKMYYHSTLTVVMVFILISFAMTVVNLKDRWVSIASLIVIVIVSSLLQSRASVALSRQDALRYAPWRNLDEKISASLRKYPTPYNLIILYDEVGMIYLNHAYFNEKLPVFMKDGLNFPVHFWKHDSYYVARLGAKSDKDVFKYYVDAMQKNDGSFVVSYCEPDDVINHADHFGSDGQKIALPLSISLTKHVKTEKSWKVVNSFDSPEGILCVYRYSLDNK